MRQIIAGRAIEGCEGPWEELALAFCRGVDAEARELRKLAQLKQELESLNGAIPGADQAEAATRQAVAQADAEKKAVSKFQITDPLLLIGALVGVLGTGAMAILKAVLESGRSNLPGWTVLLPLLAGGGMVVAYAVKRGSAISACSAKLQAAEQALAAAAAEALRLRNRWAEVQAEIQTIKPRKSIQSIGRVYFPTLLTNINGHPVLVDRSGAVPAQKHKLADFRFDSVELSEIVSRIDTLRNPPVLLSADEAAKHEAGSLHGEERTLRDTVERFSAFVGAIPTVEVPLPTMPRKSGVAEDLTRGLLSTSRFPGATVRDRTAKDPQALVEKLDGSLRKTRSQGAAPKIELLQAHARIAELLQLYQSLRSTSISAIQSQLVEAMGRSWWCNVVFHCPQMTRNPAWVLQRLGIDLPTAHAMPQDQLMSRLQLDPEITRRMEEDPELTKHLEQAWIAIQNLDAEIEHVRSSARAAASTVGATEGGNPIGMAARVRHMESQMSQHVAEYGIALNRIIFGQRAPRQEYTEQSRLLYDPQTNAWSNATGGTEYTDLDEIACARVLRVHQELLHPMWRHLWTEKADFRKAELFRSNSEALRMSEKESEKLISIANQFRDDLRMTREVLKQVQGELDGKLQQIEGTRDALERLGLLGSDGTGMMSSEGMAELAGGGSDYLRQAEQKETMLGLEPQAQAERRGSMTDPIQAISLPAVVALQDRSDDFRMRLVSQGAPASLPEGQTNGGGA